MTISEHIVSLSARTIEGIAQFRTELHKKHEQRRNYQQTKKSSPIDTTERYVCTHADFISISVKMGGASSSIPHRLNNGSWSSSLLHIKKQCTTRVFEWAVERKQPVSCQGEHPEIISIIYCTDILQRRVRQGTISTWKMHLKGEIYCLAWQGAASWFSQLVQTEHGKLFLGGGVQNKII